MSLQGKAIKQRTLLESTFHNQILYDGIISCLSPVTRLALARTCTSSYTAVEEFNKRAFDINRHLGQYFNKPTVFRTLQARTGTLISGSSALQFLDRTHYPDSDLDLYVNPGHGREVGQWLMEQEGYTFRGSRDLEDSDFEKAIKQDDDTVREDTHAYQGSYGTKSIQSVFTFQKSSSNNKKLIVQLVLTVLSAFHTIANVHSSELHRPIFIN